MTKTKIQKQVLLMSVLALVLCLSFFVGSTYAWFSDSSSSANNKIVSGSLDLQLLRYDSSSGSYITATDGTLFQGVSWEPDNTHSVQFAVTNTGSLSLKYTAAMVVINQTTNSLSDVLEYAAVYMTPASTYGLQQTAVNWADFAAISNEVVVGTQIMNAYDPAAESVMVMTLAEDTEEMTVASGSLLPIQDRTLLPGKTEYFTLYCHMDADAAATYQNSTADIKLQIVARQDSYEADSFGTDYDEDAQGTVDTPSVELIDTTEELVEAIQKSQTDIELGSATFDLSGYTALSIAEGSRLVIPENAEVIINGADNTILTGTHQEGVILNQGNLTLNNMKLYNKSDASNAPVVINDGGDMLLTNMTVAVATESTAYTPSDGPAVWNKNGWVTVAGGQYDSKTVVFFADGENAVIDIISAKVTEYEITTTADENITIAPKANTVFTATNGAKIAVTGGIYGNTTNTAYLANVDSSSQVLLSGGNFAANALLTQNSTETGLVVTGGSYQPDPTAYVDAAAYTVSQSGTRYFVSAVTTTVTTEETTDESNE